MNEWLKIDEFSLIKELELIDSSVKDDLPIPDCLLNQANFIKGLVSFRYLAGDKIEVKINKHRVKLDVYYNFVYEPKDNKRKKNKIYEVTTYNNSVQIVSVD